MDEYHMKLGDSCIQTQAKTVPAKNGQYLCCKMLQAFSFCQEEASKFLH